MMKILRFIIGYPLALLICKAGWLRKYKLFLLSTWKNRSRKSAWDNFVYPAVFGLWLREEYWPQMDPDKSEALKALCMGGECGRNWAVDSSKIPVDCASRIGSLSYKEALPFFDDIPDFLKTAKNEVTVIQVGSSSGKEISLFAAGHPKHRFIGTDIYQSVVDFAGISNKGENLTFKLVHAHKLGEIIPKDGRTVVVFSSSSLTYVHPGHLKDFFREISAVPDLWLFLLEPADEIKADPLSMEGSIPRGNFGWAHNYVYYARNCGIKVLQSRIIRPYIPYSRYPDHKGTVHYYFTGKTV